MNMKAKVSIWLSSKLRNWLSSPIICNQKDKLTSSTQPTRSTPINSWLRKEKGRSFLFCSPITTLTMLLGIHSSTCQSLWVLNHLGKDQLLKCMKCKIILLSMWAQFGSKFFTLLVTLYKAPAFCS